MISNPTIGKEYIWIGTWINPEIERVFYLKQIPPQHAISVSTELLEQPNFEEDINLKDAWICIWISELYEYSPKRFRQFTRKITFTKKRIPQIEKFKIPFSEFHKIFIENTEKCFISLLYYYYKNRTGRIIADLYLYFIYPILNIYTHDLQTIFTYSPKLIKLKEIISKKETDLEKIKNDHTNYSRQEAIEASNSIKSDIKIKNEELQSSIKILNDASRTLVAASIAFLALMFSIISFFYILSNRNTEIENFKKEALILNLKLEKLNEKNRILEVENILLQSKIQNSLK
jgi:hypothetical protein